MSAEVYSEHGGSDYEQSLDVRQFWGIFRKRRATFLQVFLVVVVVGVAATLMSKPVYQTTAKLSVPTPSTNINVLDPSNPIIGAMVGVNPDPVKTQIQALQSSAFIREVKQDLKLSNNPSVVPPSVKVGAEPGSTVIELTVSGGDPKVISLLANTLLEKHLSESESRSEGGVRKSYDLTHTKTLEARNEMTGIYKDLAEFRQAHPVVQRADEDARLQLYTTAQSTLATAEINLQQVRGEIAVLERRIAGLQEDLVRKREKANPERAMYEERIRTLTLELASLRQKFVPESDDVKEAEAALADYRRRLEATPRSVFEDEYLPNPEREGLSKRLEDLRGKQIEHQEGVNAAQSQVAALRQQLGQSGAWRPRLEDLEQQYERARTNYNRLADRLQDLEIRTQAPVRLARILEMAPEPTVPVQPRPLLNITLSLILGICLGVGVMFLQEYLDDRIHEPDDLDRVARLPSLGHIPAIEAGDERLVSSLASTSQVAEAYRAVRSAIGFAGLDGPVRLIQITSSSKGEGKSLTSVNTATAMAMDGKKVILVDADMRRPSLYKLLKLPLAPGLSEVLVGQQKWQDVIHETKVPNLQAICAGTQPPNPAELLGTRAFGQLVDDLMAQADVVIFDTPPCLPVTDPLIIASRMEAVILVISAGKTRRGAMRHTLGLLSRARARVVGAVFNGVDTKKGGYYQYYNYYDADGYYSEAETNGHRGKRNGKVLPEATLSANGVDSHPVGKE